MVKVDNKSIGPGNQLSKARDSMGLSQADIASQLNLSTAIIKQLDADKYTDDIPDAFLRGYVRTYARVVGLDEDKIVGLYCELTGKTEVSNYYVPSTDIPPVKIQIGSHLLWFKLLSIVVVTAILILGWMAYSTNQKNNNAASLESVSAAKAVMPENIETPTEVISEPNSDLIEDLTIENTTTEEIKLEESATQEMPQGFIDTPELSNGVLEFTFIDDCWVQVIDSNGEVLAVGLKSSGRRFTVNGVPPISIVLGKPRAISLQYNSEAVDLTLYPAAETARFTLGEEIETENVSNL